MGLPFYLPSFNLPISLWTNQHGTNPPLGVASLVFMGNLALSRRGAMVLGAGESWLLMPKDTSILSPGMDTGYPLGDVVEVPTGSGRFYNVAYVDDSGRGFANEHRVAKIGQLLPWLHTIPLPPPPLVPVFLGEISSDDAIVSNVTIGATVPGTGFILVSVAIFDNPGLPSVAVGFPDATQIGETTFSVFGTPTGILYIFGMAVTAGTVYVVVNAPSGGAKILGVCDFLPGVSVVNGASNANALVPPPIDTPLVPNTIPTSFWYGVVMAWNDPLLPALAPPYALLGGTGPWIFDLQNTSIVSGVFPVTVPTTPTFSCPLSTAAIWGIVEVAVG